MTTRDTWTSDEREVYDAVVALNKAGRSTNASQVSSRTGLSRQRVTTAAQHLRARGAVKDVGTGSAYNWRVVTVHVGTAEVPVVDVAEGLHLDAAWATRYDHEGRTEA